MTTESYVRDPRFEALGCSIKWGPNHDAIWYQERELRSVLANEDWSDIAIICHHAHFDGLILEHHYGVRPKLWLDTLSMARMLLGTHVSASLDSVRKHYGMPFKRTPYHLFEGRHWDEITSDVQELVAEGCNDEVESIWKLFSTMARSYPAEEYELVDITVRMFTEPVLRGDIDLLARIWTDEDARKANALAELGISSEMVSRNESFIALLAAEGVEPEYKEGKNGPIPAFAKTDDFMQELLEDENPRVAALAAARLGLRSTLMQSRAESIGFMATRGPLCIYLKHCGAHTTRWAGGDGTNFQNLPARKKETRRLRQSIMAPTKQQVDWRVLDPRMYVHNARTESFVLAKPDSSQIECRLLNFIAGQDDMIEKFRRGEDPYVGLASAIYNEPIYKAPKSDPRALEMEIKRGTGKQGELMCGYGAGWRKYQRTAAIGIYGPPVELSDLDAERHVAVYRQTHQAVTRYWKEAENVLNRLASGLAFEWGVLRVQDRRIYLPNGAPLIYDTIEWAIDERDNSRGWRVRTRKGWAKLYGSKLVENVIQALARVITGQAMIRIARMGYKICTMSHDDICILIPVDGTENDHLQRILVELKREPAWLPGVPLDAEGSLALRYGE